MIQIILTQGKIVYLAVIILTYVPLLFVCQYIDIFEKKNSFYAVKMLNPFWAFGFVNHSTRCDDGSGNVFLHEIKFFISHVHLFREQHNVCLILLFLPVGMPPDSPMKGTMIDEPTFEKNKRDCKDGENCEKSRQCNSQQFQCWKT